MNKKQRTAKRALLNAAKKAFTRRKAEKLIAHATTPEELDDPRFHPPVEALKKLNKHVTAKLEQKLQRLKAGQ
jgi:hypothetical protein